MNTCSQASPTHNKANSIRVTDVRVFLFQVSLCPGGCGLTLGSPGARLDFYSSARWSLLARGVCRELTTPIYSVYLLGLIAEVILDRGSAPELPGSRFFHVNSIADKAGVSSGTCMLAAVCTPACLLGAFREQHLQPHGRNKRETTLANAAGTHSKF